MTTHEYYRNRFYENNTKDDEGVTDYFWNIFSTYLERYPTSDIAACWASGDPKQMFASLLEFACHTDGLQSLEFEVGRLVRIGKGYGKESGKLAVVTDVTFSGLNDVKVKTEDGVSLQLNGEYLRKAELPEQIINLAMDAVKALMVNGCPLKDYASCLP